MFLVVNPTLRILLCTICIAAFAYLFAFRGGNDAAIVLPDVDVASTASEVVQGSFIFSGQVCVAIKRVYVHEDIYEEFLNAMVQAASDLVVGTATDSSTTLGPMQNRMQFEKVRNIVQDCKDQGYKFALGPSNMSDAAGCYISPSIIDNPPPTARIVLEEQFGQYHATSTHDSGKANANGNWCRSDCARAQVEGRSRRDRMCQ